MDELSSLTSNVDIGIGTIIHKHVDISAEGTIGNYVNIQRDCIVRGGGGISIGDRTLIGPGVMIFSEDHDYSAGQVFPSEQYSKGTSSDKGKKVNGYVFRKIIVGDDCWIGAGAILLKGTVLGKGVVVGAGSVVTGMNVPDYSIVAGVPAKVIKSYR